MSDIRCVKTKSPAETSGGARERLGVEECSVAHVDRPAAAGMVVPVVVRETEHLHLAYFPDAVDVKCDTGVDARPSGLRRSLAPQATPDTSIAMELASPCAPPAAMSACPIAVSVWISAASARSIRTRSGIHS